MNSQLDRLLTAEQAAGRAIDALSSLQRPDGHWCAELEGDSILQSEYILMKWILGQERAPLADGSDGWETLQRITAYMASQQREDGGFGQYPGSPVDLSATVKAYLVLKLMGHCADATHMRLAKKRIHELGGAERVNSFSNFYLACLGQVPWSAIPEIPPEIVWLPRWSYFHLDKVSAWSRTMILPLAIVSALQPTRTVPAGLEIGELFISQSERNRLTMRTEVPAGWRIAFGWLNWALGASRRVGPPTRERAITDAFAWIMERCSQDAPAPTEGLGAIFPPMVYLQVVFHALGVERTDPRVVQAERDLDEFMVRLPGRGLRGIPRRSAVGNDTSTDPIRLQPCFSPVWDTGIALASLAQCGLRAGDQRVDRATEWLLGREVAHHGDWSLATGAARGGVAHDEVGDGLPQSALAEHALSRRSPLGCWAFEYANAWYPDSDDTAMVAMALALSHAGIAQHSAVAAAKRGVAWFIQMQNSDGGWAAFDRTVDRPLLEFVPFADHNAMQDPSCPDITGRVLECLWAHGHRVGNPVVDRAIAYIRGRQEKDGSFFGRWGVNYIYGTWQSVIGPCQCGVAPSEPWVQRAGKWMKSVQKPDGSFGESANSYIDPALKGTGESTASQTAWGAMVLLQVFGHQDPDLLRAVQWLADTQLSSDDAADPQLNPDGDPAGSWRETEFTGTGFPKVFYLRYHLYRLYFPLMALGRFLEAHGRSAPFRTAPPIERQAAPQYAGA